MRQEKLAVRITSRLLFSLGVSFLASPLLAQDAPGLHIRVLSIQSLEQKLGAESPPIRLIVEDAAGHAVAGAAVALRLPEDGATGSFRNGLRTDVVLTAADGSAEAGPITWGNLPGKIALRVTAIKGSIRGTASLELTLGSLPTTIVEEPPKAPPPLATRIEPDLEVPRYRPPSVWKSKWLVVALAAGGAIAGGYAARGMQRTQAVATSVLPPAGSIDLGPVVIGPPLVTVGKP